MPSVIAYVKSLKGKVLDHELLRNELELPSKLSYLKDYEHPCIDSDQLRYWLLSERGEVKPA